MNIFNTLRKGVKFENAVLFLYLLKCLMISISYQDAVIFVALTMLHGFKNYNNRFEIRDSLDEKYKKETASELKEIKGVLSLIRLGQGPKQAQDNSKRYF